jgi:hypothetical protein
MEWYAEARVKLRATDLQRQLRIDNLPEWCAAIQQVLFCRGDKGRVRCLFGEHSLHRELIRDGVRFTLPLAEHALQWTVSADAARPGAVQLHCSTHCQQHEAAWVAILHEFMGAWATGLEGWPERLRLHRLQQADVECGPSFSGFG